MFEVIVVDDGSSCDNRKNVDAFKGLLPISYIFQDHQGVAAARNKGIKNSRGRFLVFIDDDFCLSPDYLSQVKEFFTTHPQAQVLTSHLISCGQGLGSIIQQLYRELTLWRSIQEEYSDHKVIKSNNISAVNGPIFDKNIFSAVGMYSETLQGGEDAEIAFRLAKKGISTFYLPSLKIEHWEQKSFWDFLNQRYRYGAYTFEASKKANIISKQLTDALKHPGMIFFWHMPRSVGVTYYDFLRTAMRVKKLLRFLFFSPALMLFILSFWLGLYLKALHCQNQAATITDKTKNRC